MLKTETFFPVGHSHRTEVRCWQLVSVVQVETCPGWALKVLQRSESRQSEHVRGLPRAPGQPKQPQPSGYCVTSYFLNLGFWKDMPFTY